MKNLIKNIIKQFPYLRQGFLERGQLQQPWVAYEPDLLPPLDLMRQEGISVLEEWFRWAEEWSMLLRIYGGITRNSAVLEIGCGLGRTAFPLRYVLSSDGSYDGFEICHNKIVFLEQTFHKAYPNFRFII
jgi:SAM-dependent methyltransferase